uniref:acid phosphatase n=1 Tax=Strongyloides papillosus TaxID=174720 RepID=A0A0N5B6D0_STREA
MKGLLPSLEDKYKSFLQYLSFHSGIKNLTTTDMVHLYKIINIQKQLGIKQKSWLTNETFEQMKNLTNLIYTIYDGEEGFNINRDKKIIKLNGGPLLKIIMNNFDDILLNDITYLHRKNDSYFKANSFKQKLYFSFSVYDTTILSILRLIRATDIILKDGGIFPDFAAVLIFELWRRDILNYEIALMYSKNSDSPLENVTRFIKGCGGGDYCNFEIFKFLIKDLIPIDISKECETDNSH